MVLGDAAADQESDERRLLAVLLEELHEVRGRDGAFKGSEGLSYAHRAVVSWRQPGMAISTTPGVDGALPHGRSLAL